MIIATKMHKETPIVKKAIYVILVFGISLCFFAADISQSHAEPLIRIAVVNFEEVSMSYASFQGKLSDNNEKREKIHQRVALMNDGIKRAEKGLSQMREPIKLQLEQARISQQKLELQNFFYQSMNVLESEKEQLITEARRSIYNAVRTVAIKNGISLVFSENEILYAAEDYVDITEEVVKELNREKKSN